MIGLQDFDEQCTAEVADFRKQMKYFCDSTTALLKQGSWEKRVLQLYTISLETSAELPVYLQAKLRDGNLVLSISVDHRISEVNTFGTFRSLFTKFLTPGPCKLNNSLCNWLGSTSPANHRAGYIIRRLTLELKIWRKKSFLY